jgi:hypothetical protein
MSNNTGVPPMPLPLPGDDDGSGVDPTREVDDRDVLDADADDDQVNSADADRLAAEDPSHDD